MKDKGGFSSANAKGVGISLVSEPIEGSVGDLEKDLQGENVGVRMPPRRERAEPEVPVWGRGRRRGEPVTEEANEKAGSKDGSHGKEKPWYV